MQSRTAIQALLVSALLIAPAAVSWSQVVRPAGGIVAPVGRMASTLPSSLQSLPPGNLLQSPPLGAMKLGLAAAPNAAPVGLFPSAQTPRENLLGAAPFEDQQSLLVSPVPTDDLPNGAGAALSSRGTLEAMGQAVAKAPEQLPDFIDGSRSLASFIAGPEPDEALTKQMPAPGTHFFGGELAPPRRNTFRQATAPLKAIDLSPVTPNFLSSLTVPSMNTRIQQATEALLKKLKLYKADLRIIISVIADFSRSLLPLDFVAVP